jgi:multidrug efflux system membrane fusion protein
MARIQQIDKVYVDVRRPASSLETLQQAVGRKSGQGQGGLPITILRSNGEAYENRGRILFSGINVDAGTGDVLLRIEVDNPGRQLLPACSCVPASLGTLCQCAVHSSAIARPYWRQNTSLDH